MSFKGGILSIVLVLTSLFTSCSKSGRAYLIESAIREAGKKSTIPTPNTIKERKTPKVVNIKEIVKPREQKIIDNDLIKNKIPKAEGNLIQVEGLVLKEVRKLTIDLGTTSSQLDQISKMKKHVQKKWHYIYDPASGHDTWRSAEATIALKHKGKYSGDCDDYAILLASFARQIGLKSRVIGAYDENGSGHAFAEFEIKKSDLNSIYLLGFDHRRDNGPSYWLSLDWFKGDDHNRYTKNIKVLDGI